MSHQLIVGKYELIPRQGRDGVSVGHIYDPEIMLNFSLFFYVVSPQDQLPEGSRFIAAFDDDGKLIQLVTEDEIKQIFGFDQANLNLLAQLAVVVQQAL